MPSKKFTYLTVLTNRNYLPGVWVLSRSLAAVGSRYPLTVLIPENRRDELEGRLRSWGLEVLTAPPLPAPEKLRRSGHINPYWEETFFKLRAAGLLQFQKIVLLDSDMVVLKNLDDLFDWPSCSAVAADRYSMSCSAHLNSGLMVLEPGEAMYNHLCGCMEPAVERCLVQGRSAGDQDVFHEAFPDWPEHEELQLPLQYNLLQGVSGRLCRELVTGGYKGACIVHFIGPKKPWSYSAWDYLYMAYHGFKQRNFAELRAGLKYRSYLRTLPKD